MNNPIRKNLRLRNYDYTAHNYYFVTICTYKRKNCFSTIRRGDPCGRPEVDLLPFGKIAENIFSLIKNQYGVVFDCYVIMPDHIHFIVELPDEKATARVAPTLGQIVGAYKSITANNCLKHCREKGLVMGKLWQRGYYEHVIRNEQDLTETRQYIINNPAVGGI